MASDKRDDVYMYFICLIVEFCLQGMLVKTCGFPVTESCIISAHVPKVNDTEHDL